MVDLPLLGAVLAGGRSRRFGSDKALAVLADGRTLMDHAIAAIAPHVAQVVICGRTDKTMATDRVFLPDRPAADMGPLGGLNAALHHARDYGFVGVLSTGCDMPLYPAMLPDVLVGPRAAIVERQPLLGWWPASLALDLDRHLAQDNNRSIHGWLDRIGSRIITMPGLVLPNINRREDLAEWMRR